MAKDILVTRMDCGINTGAYVSDGTSSLGLGVMHAEQKGMVDTCSLLS